MMIRSDPPASANLAEMPVPAPAPTIGRPASVWARSRVNTCSRVYLKLASHGVHNSRRLRPGGGRLAGKRFVRPDDVETQVFDWGTIKWMSEPRVTDADRFTAGIVLLAPGKGHTRHNHPGVEEILYVVAGTGIEMVEDEQG